jgi:hypothetical protein
VRRLIAAICLLGASAAFAGAQQIRTALGQRPGALHKAVSDSRPAVSSFRNSMDAVDWLAEMSPRLEKRIPNRNTASTFAQRALRGHARRTRPATGARPDAG